MRGAILAGVVVALAMAFAAPSFGATLKPWDGSNPFVCTMQYAGEGTTFQHPDADPFCVDYDKTHQDLSQLGLVTFLTKEPARVAAAMNKCWYFQQDHWTGQIIAGDGSTETYHLDGRYFFDKRWGAGGVQVENFTINHQTADPSQLPGFPPAWKPYFGPGRGGVMMSGQVRTDPQCEAKPGGTGPSPYKNESQISGQSGHGHETSGQSGNHVRNPARSPRAPTCKLGGAAHHGLGKAHLGQTPARMTRALGKPTRTRYGITHFCNLAVHFGKNGRADFIVSGAKTFHAGPTRVGSRAALRGSHVLARRGANLVLAVNHRGWRPLGGP